MIREILVHLSVLKAVNFQSIRQQIKRARGGLMVGAALIGLGLGVTGWIALANQEPANVLTRDPASVLDFPIYIGILSTWGALLWTAAAVICLFVAWLLKHHQPVDAKFMLASGLLSLLLALDDIFSIHEVVIPLAFGISEKAVYILYAAIGAIYLLRFLPRILLLNYPLLLVSIFFLGLSLMSDSTGRWLYVPTAVEDGFKYAGIVFWLVFFARSARETMERVLARTGRKS